MPLQHRIQADFPTFCCLGICSVRPSSRLPASANYGSTAFVCGNRREGKRGRANAMRSGSLPIFCSESWSHHISPRPEGVEPGVTGSCRNLASKCGALSQSQLFQGLKGCQPLGWDAVHLRRSHAPGFRSQQVLLILWIVLTSLTAATVALGSLKIKGWLGWVYGWVFWVA